MSKPGMEFHTPGGEWYQPDGSADGIWEQKLTRDDTDGSATVLQRYEPGVDGTRRGVITHTFREEVYLISGYLTDEPSVKPLGRGCMPVGRLECSTARTPARQGV